MANQLYLRKANDDLVSHCKCKKADALISSPEQMDCPWCGCGWLFICSRCNKAFTFAEAFEVSESWEEIGSRIESVRLRRQLGPGEVEKWIRFMQILLKGILPGEKYVYLDSYVIPTTVKNFTVEGWQKYHKLDFVPQVAALTDSEIFDNLLRSPKYWQSNRIKRKEK